MHRTLEGPSVTGDQVGKRVNKSFLTRRLRHKICDLFYGTGISRMEERQDKNI